MPDLTNSEAIAMLERACRYLRANYGRTITEPPRRVLTACKRQIEREIKGE